MSSSATRPIFPFSAVTGHERLKLALMLAALDPRLGGVLVSGPRGTAKSTLARSLAELMPSQGSRLVTLPLGADEAQLTGTLDLGRALGDREVAFQPGLLARAHEGVLYIDEINLLPDALVDLLLDVAASGINHIERDGISHQHPADFLLIGTMNPDEGELRPQLLDRFGLAVLDHPAPDIEQRLQIVERRLAFDHDPEAFMAAWQNEQSQLSDRLQAARERLATVTLPPELARTIAMRCVEAGVEGVRADLAWRRGALAHAAWQNRDTVALEDIEALAPLVMAHRAPEWMQDDISEDGSAGNNGGGSSSEGSNDDPGNNQASDQLQGRYQGRGSPPNAPKRPDLAPDHDASNTRPGIDPPQQLPSAHPDEHHDPGQDQDDPGNGDWGSLPARPTSPVLDSAASGFIQLPSVQGQVDHRQVPASLKGRQALGRQRIDWSGSLRRAASAPGHPIPDSPQALVRQRERRRPERLTCIVLDISGSSMSRHGEQRARQLERAMALVERLARQTYLAREQLMLLTLGGDHITEVLSPRRAPRTVAALLAGLQPGGGTPLRRGLDHTRQRLTQLKRQKPGVTTSLWILTDARSRDDLEIMPFGCETHIVDCEPAGQSLGRAQELATALGAVSHSLDALMTNPSSTSPSHFHTATPPRRTP
ncbi:magnesium chelatase [Kushneria pakistanensis]|uniref:Magnesium chelatase n=1 Tax=Kushneria pakistanensis TaxID=1508770 RepID=A0ABQ3FDP4_9GAMM|nr:AAA family ATPase [Kushneria pakistanensis]GHC19741.1 magnesium chelatase [Kushneria pakistanensis]